MCGEFDDNSLLRASRSYISALHYTNSISEPGKIDKSCSRVLDTVSVSPSTTLFGSSTNCDYLQFFLQKANSYCTGNAVSGVQSVNFSVNCTECAEKDSDQANFLFRVYSESFSESTCMHTACSTRVQLTSLCHAYT